MFSPGLRRECTVIDCGAADSCILGPTLALIGLDFSPVSVKEYWPDSNLIGTLFSCTQRKQTIVSGLAFTVRRK